ncbi:hypothetical protein [Leifsonia poae]
MSDSSRANGPIAQAGRSGYAAENWSVEMTSVSAFVCVSASA